MNKLATEERYTQIIEPFLDGKIGFEQFCADFTRAWMEFNGAMYEQIKEWPERYDLELYAAYGRGELTDEIYRDKWEALWGYAGERFFINTADRIHSACDVCFETPEKPGEISPEQLRQEVKELWAAYRAEEAKKATERA